jgi:hypothetical protein
VSYKPVGYLVQWKSSKAPTGKTVFGKDWSHKLYPVHNLKSPECSGVTFVNKASEKNVNGWVLK